MDNNYKVRGKLPDLIIMPMEACEELLGSLDQSRRDLTVALQAITLSTTKAEKFVVQFAPDQWGAQVQFQQIGDPLFLTENLVEAVRESLERTHERAEAFWQAADQIRELYRRGELVLATR